jgi:hypothetical protein
MIPHSSRVVAIEIVGIILTGEPSLQELLHLSIGHHVVDVAGVMTRFPAYVVAQHVIHQSRFLQRVRWHPDHLVASASVILRIAIEALVSKVDWQ